jgi:hypothetical protein
MQDWQRKQGVEKIRDGMELIKKGCQGTVCNNICPFYNYCSQGQRKYIAPVNWQIPEVNNYTITLEYQVLVSGALNKEIATKRAIDALKHTNLSCPDNIEIELSE